jgi:O-phosphoseryl-tRNA(Sec) kinase
MLYAIVTIGIPCSGKSTWSDQFVAEKDNWVKLERDDIRMKLFSLEHYNDYRFSKDNEKMVTNCFDMLLDQAKRSEMNVIVADTNLNKKFREQLIDKLKGMGYHVFIQRFPISVEEALERNKNRDKYIPEEVIINMAERFEQYVTGEQS